MQEVMENALLGMERSNYNLDFETKEKEMRHLLINNTISRDHEGRRNHAVAGIAHELHN